MAHLEIVDLAMKHGDFPVRKLYVYPFGTSLTQFPPQRYPQISGMLGLTLRTW